MFESNASSYHVEDVGKILLQVQSDLADLRAQVSKAGPATDDGHAGGVHSKLDDVLAQAEADLRVKAEVVLNSVLQSGVSTLPSLSRKAGSAPSGTAPGGFGDGRSVMSSGSRLRSRVEDARKMEYLTNLDSPSAKEYLKDRYGIQFKLPGDKPRRGSPARTGGRPPGGRRIKEKMTRPHAALPTLNRIDATAPKPRLTEDDVSAGVFSLMERGLIPSHVDLSEAFTEGRGVLRAGAAPMHTWDAKFDRAPTYVSPFGVDMTAYKLDIDGSGTRPRGHSPPRGTRLATTKLEYSGPLAKPPPGGGAYPGPEDSAGVAMEKIRDYNELLDEFSLHQFIIRKGVTMSSTPEFASYQRTHSAVWGGIMNVIRALEKFLSKFGVPTAYIDGQAVADLALDELASINPPPERLLACVANLEQVSPLISIPGRRFKGPSGMVNAATAIQATWRMCVARRRFLEHHEKVASVAKIVHCFRAFKTLGSTRTAVRKVMQVREKQWEERQAQLRAKWASMQTGRRVVIHIPSITVEHSMRAGTSSLPNAKLREGLQIAARLCDIRDPLVDVVYVSPFALPDDVYSYYAKLLGITVKGATSRFKVVVPENIARFPETMSLAQLLLYSPRALRRIRRYARSAESYIVPGHAGLEDKLVSIALEIPLLAPDPTSGMVSGSKSGAKRIFAVADVNVPPGAYDLYEAHEVVSSLAALVAVHIQTNRWLLKIDNQWGGRGHAYIDVGNMKTVAQLREQRASLSQHDPDYWMRPEVQAAARDRLLVALSKTLPRRTVLAVPSAHIHGWKSFLESFSKDGGVIEATPNDVMGSPSANLFIAPNGTVTVTSTHEQLFATPYVYSGCEFPQRSVPHAAIVGASTSIGEALSSQGVMGHVGVDFVTYWDPDLKAQRLWAVDLNLRLTSSACTFAMFDFLLQGETDPKSGFYYTAPEVDEASDAAEAKGADEGEEKTKEKPPVVYTNKYKRCYVAHDWLVHPNLSTLRYGTFFNLCRLQGVSFDLQRREGAAFTLVDSLASGVIGLMTIARTPLGAMRTTQKGFSFVAKETGLRAPESEFGDEKSNLEGLVFCVNKRVRVMEGKPTTAP